MTPGKYDLDLYRGDSYAWRFRFWTDAGQTIPVDLTGATVKAEYRDKPGGAVVVAMTCTVTLPNTVDMKFTTAMWADAPAAGSWDLQATYSNGVVNTYVAGKVTVTADVTDSTGTMLLAAAAPTRHHRLGAA